MTVHHLLAYFRAISLNATPVNFSDIFPECAGGTERFGQVSQSYIRRSRIKPRLHIHTILKEKLEISTPQHAEIRCTTCRAKGWLAGPVKTARAAPGRAHLHPVPG